MMWRWSLLFVVIRYLISSLFYRWKFEYNNLNDNMEVINYLHDTLTTNLLALIIAMKYNIYISFVTISYMISIILYPIIVFCGLLLFTDVEFVALSSSVRFVVLSV